MARLALCPRLLSGNAVRTWCALFALLLAAPALAAMQSNASYDPLWVGYPLPGTSGAVRALCEYDGRLVVGSDGDYFGTTATRRIASWDGLSWQALGTGVPVQVNALTKYGTKLIAGGSTSASNTPGVNEKPAIFAWDGATWTTIGTPNGTISALAVIGTDLYVGGNFTSVSGVPAARIARWDGTNWFALGAGFATNTTVRALANHGGTLVAGGTITAYQGIAQWNGATWSTVGAGLQSGASAGAVNALVSDGTTLWATGTFTSSGGSPVTNTAAWNGSTWSGLAGANVAGSALALYGGFPMSTVQTAGIQSPQLWNGAAWLPFNQPNTQPLAYGYLGSTLYAGAGLFFLNPDQFTIGRFHAFNGSTWSIQQQAWDAGMKGFGGQGYCAQEWHGELYVGGTMGNFGTGSSHIVSSGIGKWTGSNWVSIGTGRQHFDLEVWNDSLIASCDDRVRVWTGSSWRNLNPNASNTSTFLTFANRLVVLGGDLYALGSPSIYNQPSEMIARWTGSTWVSLTPGIDDPAGFVEAGATWNGKIVIGGSFNSAAGVPVRNLVAWNGTTTSEIGGGVNGLVECALDFGGDLIVGGDFTEAGSTPVSAAARWDGAAWYAMGTRATRLYTLRSRGGKLYAGGVFLDDNNIAVGGTALWTGTEWQLLGSGLDPQGYVGDIEFLGDDLYMVGSFGRANGHAARNFAKLPNVSALDAPPVTPRTSRLMLAPSANPSRGALRFAVTLPSAGRARVTIHDISGREVARLLDGSHAAGEFSLEWSARVAPGLYLATIESAGERASTRVVRLR